MAASISSTEIRGKLECDVPMAPYTTWRAGGCADRVFWPADKSDLAAFMATLAEDEAVYYIGLGSNLLIRDGGLDGTVIMLHTSLTEWQSRGNSVLYLESGIPCAKAAKIATKQGLTGLEFFAGIPGTVGGALAMNAGAFGGETWPLVRTLTTCNRQGGITTQDADSFVYTYRHVDGLDGRCILGAEFALQPIEQLGDTSQIKALLAERARKQPLGAFSCGSVFKNPPNDYAARLIEAVGMKGKRNGGAIVSPKHANFILNEDNASAADIESLMWMVQTAVLDKFGIKLDAEARIIGRKGDANA